MKKLKLFSLAFAAMLSLGFQSANAQSLSPTTKWHWNKGKIVIEVDNAAFSEYFKVFAAAKYPEFADWVARIAEMDPAK